ncbi:hypothetical protein PAP_07750 [Palaeococcus pacificus DY20341]|uniref:Uncharacterized protein n=1 Tax=Palaeococcus pacificus DY20341 TaxID=1343739 RepID=A0A075LU91_9EURY|nr:hypothetical protein PAP_07750 [Palaeococcus pacificus DY20341]
MGNIKKSISLFAIILMIASTLGYAGFSYFASSKERVYSSEQVLNPRSAVYYELLSESHLSGTIESSAPISVYIFNGEELQKLKSGETGTPYKAWENTKSVVLEATIPKGDYYLVILNPGYESVYVKVSLTNER